MNKILPVRFPFITSYPYYANPLTILAATGNEYIPWMLNNFIQLSCHPENKILKVDFFQEWITWAPYSCPHLDVQFISKEIYEADRTIIDTLIYSINKGYYIQMKVNHKYLSFSKATWYKQKDMAHELLVYGYDLNNKTLNVADNFGGKYEYKICSFEEFLNSYRNTSCFNLDYYEKVMLYKPTPDQSIVIDPLKISDSFIDFLESRDTRNRDNRSVNWANNIVLGINTYNKIHDYIMTCYENHSHLDHRLLHVVWEHKKCMVARIELLQSIGIALQSPVLDMYKDLERVALIYRNIIIKAIVTKNNSKLENVAKGILSFINTETNILNELLEQIYFKYKNSDEISILGNSNNISRKWSLLSPIK